MTLSKLDVMLSVVWVVWWIVFDWLVVALCSGGEEGRARWTSISICYMSCT